MKQQPNRLRQILVGTAAAAGVIALLYGSVVVKPDPTKSLRRAHAERGQKLGIVNGATKTERVEKEEQQQVKFPVSTLPNHSGEPVWAEPQYEPWVIRQVGLSYYWPGIVASYTFRNPAEETRAWQGVRGRGLYCAVAYSNLGGKFIPPEATSPDADAVECHRTMVEPLMDDLMAAALRSEDAPFSEEFLRPMPTVIAYAALHGDADRAGRLLDHFVKQVMEAPWFYGLYENSRLSIYAWPGATLQLLSMPDFNHIAYAALFLDEAGVDTVYLDRIAEGLERNAPSREKLDWMAESVLLAQFQKGEQAHSDIYATRENPLRYFAGGMPEWALNTIQQPLLKAQYRDFFAAWMRRDIPAAMAARASYTATVNRMSLRNSAIDDGFGMLRRASSARWCRACSDAPARLDQLEMARFVVASLRFRRAEGRWPQGLDELVPAYLPAGSVGGDGARWSVAELPAFDGPMPNGIDAAGPLTNFRTYAEQIGEPPDVHSDVATYGSVFDHHVARPLFCRLGTADPCGQYVAWRMMGAEDEPLAGPQEDERRTLVEELTAGRSGLVELQAWMPLHIPDPRALRLLRPRESDGVK